ncbi:pilus assembly protein PilM, partial [bacterium]|nr:pilus assembly protein PilM [bacterium]
FNDIFFTYEILSEKKDGLEILLIAANVKVILEWQRLFEKLGLDVDFFDVETLAVFRGLNLEEGLPVAVVDIGSASSNISIFNKKGLRYVYSLGLAGNHWTDKLAQSLGVDLEQAEKKKKIIKIPGKTKGAQILTDEIDFLIKEIKDSLNYYKIKYKKEVKNIILLGGSSQLKGLVEYLVESFKGEKIKISLGQANLKKLPPIEYIEAIGLAIKGMDKKWLKKDIHFNLTEVKKFYKQKQLTILKEKKTKKEKNQEQIQIIETDNSNSKSRVKLLVIILILGTFLVVGAFWYRNYQEGKKEELQDKRNKEILDIHQTSVEEELTTDIDEESEISTSSTELILDNTTSEDLDLDSTTSTEDLIDDDSEYIIINDNPLGWLNVRSGPGTNYEILIKIYPGEEYVMLKEESDWYQIKISEEALGWIHVDYASVKNTN